MIIGKPFRNLSGRRVQSFYFGQVWLTFIGIRPKLLLVCSDSIARTPFRLVRWGAMRWWGSAKKAGGS